MDYNMYANNQEYCSSGCESGWTLYLEEHSSVSPEPSYDRESNRSKNRGFTAAKEHCEDDENEDEDLSMVSDASSGPPHLEEAENNGCSAHHCNNAEDSSLSRSSVSKKKTRENRRRSKAPDHSSLLDDTASSPFFDFSNVQSRSPAENVLEYSQGYSTTQFEVRPPYQQHYSNFFQPGNQMQQQNQW